MRKYYFYIQIGNNKIGDLGMKYLSRNLIYSPLLKNLILSIYEKYIYIYIDNNQIGVEGIKSFGIELICIPELVSLNLSDNVIANLGLMNLCVYFNHIKKLRSLNLRNYDIYIYIYYIYIYIYQNKNFLKNI